MKKILISIFSALLLGGISLPASAQAQGPADNEIWYTATAKLAEVTGTGTEHGLHIDVFADAGGYPVGRLSHEWDEETGKGVIAFDGDIATVGENAFYYCIDLSSVTFSANVTSIGKNAFYYCYNSTNKTGLETVTFAEGSILETIEESAFYYCNVLSSITIPASVTSIGKTAFNNCLRLATVTFAEGSKLGTIGQQAFMGCTALSSITIPASVTSIGKQAFFGCTKMETVTFAEGIKLETIGESAFSNSGISSVTIPASVTSIGNGAFESCYNRTTGGLTTVTFAEGSKLEAIGDEAFQSCSGLSSITIPASVTSIGNSAFKSCYDNRNRIGLTTVTFAEGSQLETIGESAFEACRVLSSITIPASVTEIGQKAFAYCRNLKSVTVNWTAADKIVQINSNVFNNCPEGWTLLVPAGTEDLYSANESWSRFKDYMKPYITANQDPNNKKDYYATFYSSSKAYKLSTEDVTAYTGAVDGSVLKLKPIADGIIPADEGVVLKLTSTDDTGAKVIILVEESTEAGTKDTENVLTGTDTAIDSAPAGTKAFSLGESGVGFYLWTEKPIGAHKAYIPAATQE